MYTIYVYLIITIEREPAHARNSTTLAHRLSVLRSVQCRQRTCTIHAPSAVYKYPSESAAAGCSGRCSMGGNDATRYGRHAWKDKLLSACLREGTHL